MHERWFQPGKALVNPHGGENLIRGRVGKCSNFSYPNYPLKSGACGVRVMPASIQAKSCAVMNFSTFETTIKRFEPGLIDGKQVPHVYLGIEFRESTRPTRGLKCLKPASYFELGYHAQGLNTGGVAGLYIRVAPDPGAAAKHIRQNRAKGSYGARLSESLKPKSFGKTISGKAGYMMGDWNERSRFLTDSPMKLQTGIRAEKSSKGGYKIFAFAKAQGKRVDGDAQDIIQIEVGSVSAALAKSESAATDRFQRKCVKDQRVTMDGPLRATGTTGSPKRPFRYDLKSTAFKDSTGKSIALNGLVMQYPTPRVPRGEQCMSFNMEVDKLGAPLAHALPFVPSPKSTPSQSPAVLSSPVGALPIVHESSAEEGDPLDVEEPTPPVIQAE